MPDSPASPAPRLAEELHRLAIQLLRRLRIEDAKSGIPPARLSALSVLVFGGPLSMGALASAEQVKPPTMTRIVDGLVADGLATRTADAGDARTVHIRATARGKRLLLAGRDRRVARLESALASLSAHDRAALTNALAPLALAIRSIPTI
jgi:DNA-binding MarR family transcriptional regulator